jgi:hypothetical protein
VATVELSPSYESAALFVAGPTIRMECPPLNHEICDGTKVHQRTMESGSCRLLPRAVTMLTVSVGKRGPRSKACNSE